MPQAKSITVVTTEMYELLEPLESADRQRALQATLALLGETLDGSVGSRKPLGDRDGLPPLEDGLSEKAIKWMRQNQVDRIVLDQCFHIDNSDVELIVSDVNGSTRREKTVNCYLMVGVRNLLANGEPKFADKEALDFCHLVDAYDRNNHTSNRNTLGNRVSGDRTNGFVLTVPGLRDAAKLIKALPSED